MTDKAIEIPVTPQDRFKALLAVVKEAHKEPKKEARRSREINTSFYEKIFALDAGFIAVVVSVGIALLAKPELRSTSLRAISPSIVVFIIFLWGLSLICAVAHNFVVASIAKLEAAYSEDDFVRTILRESFATARVTDSVETQSVLDQIEEKAQEEPLLRQRRNVEHRECLNSCATALGYASIGSFFAAFALVMFWVGRLWWITR